MAHPLGFFHKLLLPFYSPVTIARIISRKSPNVGSQVLESLIPQRTFVVLKYLDENYRLKVLNNMGEYLFHLTKLMSTAELAKYLTILQGGTVRRLSMRISERLLASMIEIWNESELVFILTNVHPKKGAYIIQQLPKEQQVTMLRALQTWVQAALIKDMPPDVRAEVIDSLNLEPAVDLLTRWSLEVQSNVLRMVSKQRRNEVLATMRPRMIAEVIDYWPKEEKMDLLNSLKEEDMVKLLFNFTDDTKRELFLLLPPMKQRYIIINLRTDQAITFLKYLPDDEIAAHLKGMDQETSSLLIKFLNKQEED
jgi:Mg/Co/Ni transporter MgtE